MLRSWHLCGIGGAVVGYGLLLVIALRLCSSRTRTHSQGVTSFGPARSGQWHNLQSLDLPGMQRLDLWRLKAGRCRSRRKANRARRDIG
jgi:hypothetical protein